MLEVINLHDSSWYPVVHINNMKVEFIAKEETNSIKIEQAIFRFRNRDGSTFFLGKVKCE